MRNFSTEKRGLTVDEACYTGGFGRSRFYEAVAAGQIVIRKFGRRTLVLKEDLDKFLNSLPAANFGIKQPGTLESRPAKSDGVTPTPRFPRAKQRSAAVGRPAQT